MEPTRKKVEFSRLEGAYVVLVDPPTFRICPLWNLGGELFAETFADIMIALYRDGFTSNPVLRWEHFKDSPVHIRANALGRIVICQS